MKYSQQVLVALLAGAGSSQAFTLQSRVSFVSDISKFPAQKRVHSLFASTLEDTETEKDEKKLDTTDVVGEEGIIGAKDEEILSEKMFKEVELEAQKAVEEMLDEECEVDEEGEPVDEVCYDEEKKQGFRSNLKGIIGKTLQLVRGSYSAAEQELADEYGTTTDEVPQGEVLQKGWEKRANSRAIIRNAEIWKFALAAVTRVLKPKTMAKKGASEEEVKQAQIEAAEFIRDNLLKLGPSFIKVIVSVGSSLMSDVLYLFYSTSQ